MTGHLNEVMADALTYASWGWRVYPARGKVPSTPHGFRDATTDPDVIIAWWMQHPRRNVGIATGPESGLLVIDVDTGGLEPLKEVVRKVGPLPETLAVSTPSGGWHAYFRYPDVEVRSGTGKVAEKVDIRAAGGCVNAPPSQVDGRHYRWRDEPWPGPPDLASLPEAWVELLAHREPARPAQPVDGIRDPQAYARAAFRNALQEVEAAAEGTRNATTFKAAAALSRFVSEGWLLRDPVEDELVASAVAAGLDQDEARRAVRSGLR